MQQKRAIVPGIHKTSNRVSALIERSGSYYSAWLNSKADDEAVKLSLGWRKEVLKKFSKKAQ
jgi:hypothetical protein